MVHGISRLACAPIRTLGAFLIVLVASETAVSAPGLEKKINLMVPRVTAAPGDVIEVPVLLRTEIPLSLAGFSIEFDPTILELLEVRLAAELEAIVARPDRIPGVDWIFESFSNQDEGWVQGLCVLDYAGSEEFKVPEGEDLQISTLVFLVKSDAREGQSLLHFTRRETARFRGEFLNGDQPVYNPARRHGPPFRPEERFRDTVDPDVEDGSVQVSIIGDVGIFVRGDANVDQNVDISDSLSILGALFLGQEVLPCDDAADANDDGGIDISDPVAILDYLFTGLSTVPLHGLRVVDQTPDNLDCASATG
jgi:hypothetical protein